MLFDRFLRRYSPPSGLLQSTATEHRVEPSVVAPLATRDAPASDPWAWAEGLVGPPTAAGKDVSPQRALECAPVRNAVELNSGQLGTLTLAFVCPPTAAARRPWATTSRFPFVALRDPPNGRE